MIHRAPISIVSNCYILLLIAFIFNPSWASNNDWSSQFRLDGPNGPGSVVNAVLADGNGNLYVGGRFGWADGKTVNNVARWDGSEWNALGNGVDDVVYALALDAQGRLIVGGSFTQAGEVPADNVARWDANSDCTGRRTRRSG